jgi:YVTN family beta-propeller protein
VDPKPASIALTGPQGAALPSGMALSKDGSKLYVALNGNNTLEIIDTATNSLVKQIPVGNAPRQVVVAGGEAFVSNEGGRPAGPGDFTNLSDGTPVVADSSTGAPPAAPCPSSTSSTRGRARTRRPATTPTTTPDR